MYDDDLENDLSRALNASAERVSARPDLQDRLITTASTAPPRSTLRDGIRRSAWALPLAAAVVTALSVGGVVLAGRQTHSRHVVSGADTTVPSSSAASSAPPLIPTVAPTPAPTATHRSTPPAPRSSTSPAPTTASRSHEPSTPPPSSEVTSSPTAATSPPVPTGPVVPAACRAAAGGTSNPTTVAEFTRRVTGTWLMCPGTSVLGGTQDGFQVAANGTWSSLYYDGSGTRLHRVTGLHLSGTWKVVDDSDMNGHPAFQLNLESGHYTYILLADFATAVDRVRFDNNGTLISDYVPTTLPIVAKG